MNERPHIQPRFRRGLIGLAAILAGLTVSVLNPSESSAATTSVVDQAPSVTAAATWRSWNFNLWTGGKRGHTVGKVAYKSMGVKKRYGTCYRVKLPAGNNSWVDDTKADGYGVIVKLIFTDCRDGHTVRVTAGYIAGVNTPLVHLKTGTYTYATKAGVQICTRDAISDSYCRIKR